MDSGGAKAATDIHYRRKRGGVDWDGKYPPSVMVLSELGDMPHMSGSWQKLDGKLKRDDWQGFTAGKTYKV